MDARHPQPTKIVVPSDDESEESPVRTKEKAKSVTTDSSQELDKSMTRSEEPSSEEDTLEVAKTVSKSRRKKKDPKKVLTQPKQSACTDKSCCLIF